MGKLIDPKCYVVATILPYTKQVDGPGGIPYDTNFLLARNITTFDGGTHSKTSYLMTKEEARHTIRRRGADNPGVQYTILKVQEVS